MAHPFVGLIGGWLASLVHWPLPWITGALVAVTLYRCLGWYITAIPHGRPAGQWLIATAIGLHFTPAVLTEVVGHLPLMTQAAIATLLMALLRVTEVQRLGTELKTAFFAFMPANFAEMINLPRVAAGHALRRTGYRPGRPRAATTGLALAGTAAGGGLGGSSGLEAPRLA